MIWGRIWPVPLSLVMLDQSNLPPEWSSGTIWESHIRMIGMPFQIRLLDLKFENDRVTCFGNRTVMNCVSFQPGSWPIHAKYIKIPQSLVITNFNRINASRNQRCIALPFVISLTSLSYGRVLIRPFCISSLCFFPHDPILTKHQAFVPSSPILLPLKPRPLRVEFFSTAWAKAWQETLTWETRWSTQHTSYRKHAKIPP